MVKKILSIVLWVVTAAALVVLFIFAREDYLETPLKAINITAEPDSGFVRRHELHEMMEQRYGNSKIGTVDMVKIQRQLDANPWIESNTAYIDLDGNLNISFQEHQPKFRIYGKNGHSVYITHDGIVLPSSHSYTPYVLIASGNFDLGNDTTTRRLSDTLDGDRNALNALYWFEAIEKNPFIANCAGQLYCNNRNQFELTVKGLDARIILGDTCLAADKLNRLEIFMKQRIKSPETKATKIINLNYKNQIVCTKR